MLAQEYIVSSTYFCLFLDGFVVFGSGEGIFPGEKDVYVLLEPLTVGFGKGTADELAGNGQEISGNNTSVDQLGNEGYNLFLEGCSELVTSISLFFEEVKGPQVEAVTQILLHFVAFSF